MDNGDHLVQSRPSACEDWTPEQKGRALEMIRILAATPPCEWLSKEQIHKALAEFRA